ncbi:hypothetical protein [Streptomyces acidiscabies]|uniref:SMI1/KNR4 family protein n=1 Tax=Streptomyces acidiscabies TaxID=42234 RepID=A0ABU4LYG2_9ACTN|nr:hypothetical protein [Streptomyces acidiscabies]MDX3020039.1 hypothetical protein [Streptomyces acidiscabies]
MTESLPHDEYMADVEDELAVYGAAPGRMWTATPDGEKLDAVFTDFPEAAIDADRWPNGVYLGWDQRRGWVLIEAGGGHHVTALDPNGVDTYSSPRQVACSTANALQGRRSTGPISSDGPWWDSRPLEAAIAVWERGES